jgi:hypothetical protein
LNLDSQVSSASNLSTTLQQTQHLNWEFTVLFTHHGPQILCGRQLQDVSGTTAKTPQQMLREFGLGLTQRIERNGEIKSIKDIVSNLNNAKLDSNVGEAHDSKGIFHCARETP